MFGCHGDPDRYYTLYGRNRLRIDEEDESLRNAFLTEQERATNFAATRVLTDPDHPEDSVLLRKALDQEAGGWYHRGAVIFGQGDVFLDPDEPDYQVILSWISGEKEDPTCIEPGSTL